MKIFKQIVASLFGLMFINSGLNKFFNYMPMPELTPQQQEFFAAFMKIGWLNPLVAIVEILGGLLFIFPKTRALGAIVILPVMVGILLHHITMEPSGLPIAAVLFLINLWMLWDNREKYRAIFA